MSKPKAHRKLMAAKRKGNVSWIAKVAELETALAKANKEKREIIEADKLAKKLVEVTAANEALQKELQEA